jgi:hypothetical protein
VGFAHFVASSLANQSDMFRFLRNPQFTKAIVQRPGSGTAFAEAVDGVNCKAIV